MSFETKMLSIKLFLKFVIILNITAVINSDVCDSVNSLCDCSIEVHGEWTNYQMNCTHIQNGETKFSVNTKLTYPPTLEIDCIGFISLVDLPELHLNDKFATIKFSNCFSNDTSHGNYKFKFFDFVRKKLSVGFWSKIDIRFSMLGKVDEDLFFGNWNYPRVTHIYIENVHFETSSIFKKRNDIRMFSFSNTNLIDMDKVNENCAMLRDLDFRHTRTIRNFNRLNLRKIKNLEVLRIKNCAIENYYDQMFSEGSVFEGNAKLISVTFESVYDGVGGEIIKLNETLFNEIQLTTVQLVDLKLGLLPPKIFWNLHKLTYLVLRKNQLKYIDKNIFINCLQLKVIDLSYNNFVKFTDTTIFSSIVSLQELHLSFNQLTSFTYSAENQVKFEKLQLDHNKLQLNTLSCPIVHMKYQDAVIDFSFNKISTVGSILDCILRNDLKLLNMSNNQIDELNIRKIFMKATPQPLNTELDFRNNRIIAIDILTNDNWNENVYPVHNIDLHIDSNPIFCNNCQNIRQIYAKDFLYLRLNNGTIIKINHPQECRIAVFCSIATYYKAEYRCPKPCDCLYNEFSRILAIDCESRNLTEIPYMNATDIFELNVTRININLKNNSLRNFSFGRSADGEDTLNPIKSIVASIDLDNNLFDSLYFPPFQFPEYIEQLKLASNQIGHIDDEAIDHLNSRGQLLSVWLTNNTILNDVNLYAILKQKIKFKLIEEVEEEFENEGENQVEHDEDLQEKKRTRSDSLSVIWVVLIFITISVILLSYVYRRYSVGRVFARGRKEIQNRD